MQSSSQPGSSACFATSARLPRSCSARRPRGRANGRCPLNLRAGGEDRGGSGRSGDGGRGGEARLPSRTLDRAQRAARDFATQRAAQQTIFTSRVLRDETRARWLDEFAGGGMEDAHVADALRRAGGRRVTSDDFLRDLLRSPPETIVVKKPYAGRGGSTKTNPYLKQKFFQYEVDMLPIEIGRRVMDARLQVAQELVVDLKLVSSENERLWRCYREAMAAGDQVDVADALDEPAHTALMDTNEFPGAGSGSSSNSPYRVATYDLSLNFTLHIAVEHVVRELLRGGRERDQREGEWLRGFSAPRSEALLRPPRGIRRAADAFVAALLSESPLLRDGKVVCDPRSLCERLLDARLAVSRVWIETLRGAAEERLALEREVLEGSL